MDELPTDVIDTSGDGYDPENSTPGFVTDANLPGDVQGETNGYYAGVTENRVDTTGYDYLAANPSTRTDLLSGFRNAIRDAGSAVTSFANQRANVAQANARASYLSRQGYKPTLVEQFQAMSAFEQVAFVSAVIGIVWFFSRKAA